MNQYSTVEHSRQSHIKLYAGLARTVMALDAHSPEYAGLLRQFRWWTALRGAKPHGVEWFTDDEVIAIFARYGMSRTQYYNLVTTADNGSIFFTVDDSGIVRLSSLQNVCTALLCVPGDVVLIPCADVAGHISRFKAAIRAAQNAYRPSMASRATLQKELGLSASTQRRYEKTTGLSAIANYCEADRYDSDGLPVESLPIPDDAYFWFSDDGQRVIWQVPNLYAADREFLQVGLKPARRGLARKVGKLVRSGLNDTGEVERRQRFFYLQEPKRAGQTYKPEHSHAILQRDANGTPLTYCRPSSNGEMTAGRLFAYHA